MTEEDNCPYNSGAGNGTADGSQSATQDTVLLSRGPNKRPETVPLNQLNKHKDRSCWKSFRRRLCSSHRFKNLQVRGIVIRRNLF